MNKIKKFNEELDMLASKDRLEISFDEVQVILRIRSDYYIWTKGIISEEEPTTTDGIERKDPADFYPPSPERMTKKDVKQILKTLRKRLKDLKTQGKIALEEGADIYWDISEFISFPYSCKMVSVTKRNKWGVMTLEEIPTIIRAITYFLDNIHSWEGYHGMHMTMSLKDSYNYKLEKWAYLP